MVAAELVDIVNSRLAGYENAVDPASVMSAINQAKDELWSTIKSLDKEYFMQVTQSSSPAGPSYFGPLQTNAREYTLPSDCKSIEFIECLTAGYETADFQYVEMSSQLFVQNRRAGGIAGQAQGVASYNFLYTVIGKDQFVLTNYPVASLVLRLWYIRSIPDFEAGDNVDEFIVPYVKAIADFAIQKIMLSIQDPTQFSLWAADWKREVQTLAQGEGTRDLSSAVFVEDFGGD